MGTRPPGLPRRRVTPVPSASCSAEITAELRQIDAGDVARYIPSLTRADPDDLAVSLVTVDGHGYSAGEPDTLLRLVELAEQELTSEMTPEAVEVLESLVPTRVLPEGATLFSEGDAADSMFFVAVGQVSIDILVGPRRRWWLTSIGPGHALGELSMVDGGLRSIRAVADAPTLGHVLTRAAMDRIDREHPDVSAALYRSIAQALSHNLRRLTGEIRSLER